MGDYMPFCFALEDSSRRNFNTDIAQTWNLLFPSGNPYKIAVHTNNRLLLAMSSI